MVCNAAVLGPPSCLSTTAWGPEPKSVLREELLTEIIVGDSLLSSVSTIELEVLDRFKPTLSWYGPEHCTTCIRVKFLTITSVVLTKFEGHPSRLAQNSRQAVKPVGPEDRLIRHLTNGSLQVYPDLK